MDTSALLKSVPTGIWIGGEEREGSSTFDVLDPSDDSVLISIANATADDAIAALDGPTRRRLADAATALGRSDVVAFTGRSGLTVDA